MSRIEPEPIPAESKQALVGMSAPSEILLAIGSALGILIPCFWLPHIQAGDFSSHLYNAWLAGQIEAGRTEGLRLVPGWTNVLSDWALQWLIYHPGPVWAERCVASVAVLIFFSGAFWLIYQVTGRRPWLLAPCLGMLTYGLIFQAGFLNYYIAAGLCLWIVALGWHPLPRRSLLIAPLAALAILAHPFPLIWAAALLGYVWIWRRLPEGRRFVLPIISFAALALIPFVLTRVAICRWSPGDLVSPVGIAGLTGVEQVWLYGPQYLIVAGGLLLIWCAMFLERLDRAAFLSDPIAQLWLFHLMAFVVLPSAIQFPQYQHVLAYIPQRISLLGAILFCALVGGARYRKWITQLSALVGVAFFTFLYIDGAALNHAEDEITALVANLPPGQRVVSAVTDSGTRLNAMEHAADRACIGHCFSYGNYEPATAQFRVRVLSDLAPVAPDMRTVKEIEEGRHVVTAREDPLYSVCACPAGKERFCLRELHAGQTTCAFSLAVTPRF